VGVSRLNGVPNLDRGARPIGALEGPMHFDHFLLPMDDASPSRLRNRFKAITARFGHFELVREYSHTVFHVLLS